MKKRQKPAREQGRKFRQGKTETAAAGKRFPLLKLFVCLLIFFSSSFAQEISVTNKFQKGDFPLIYKNFKPEILISKDDFKVVEIAANDFASDIERVTNRKSKLKCDANLCVKSENKNRKRFASFENFCR